MVEGCGEWFERNAGDWRLVRTYLKGANELLLLTPGI